MAARDMSVNLGLATTPNADIKDIATYTELLNLFNAVRNIVLSYDTVLGLVQPAQSELGELDVTHLTVGGLCKIYKTASVDIAFGKTVRLIDAGAGVAQAALGTTGNTIGVCVNSGGVLAGSICEILLLGLSPSFAAGTLVPGNSYYQSATPGAFASSGTQFLGRALSDTQLFFNPA